MTLFLLLAAVLAALALSMLLVLRGPTPAAGAPAEGAIAATRPSRGLALALAGVVLVVAASGYAWVGSPGLLAVTPTALRVETATPETAEAAQAIATVLHARAEKNPKDPAAWFQWARAELDADHPELAAEGYRKAIALRPNDPDLLADGADVLAVAAHGRLEGEPMQLVDRALAIDPNHLKALALKGSAALEHHDFAGALAAWEQALKVAPHGDPIGHFLARQVAGLREMMAGQGAMPLAAEAASAAASSSTR
jgi:cytochrome c-type biogenesis protein CcmH